MLVEDKVDNIAEEAGLAHWDRERWVLLLAVHFLQCELKRHQSLLVSNSLIEESRFGSRRTTTQRWGLAGLPKG